MFRPEPMSGREFRSSYENKPGLYRRTPSFADAASNGLIGFTTGVWESVQKLERTDLRHVGDYATVWRRDGDGAYHAILNIETSYDPDDRPRDLNTDKHAKGGDRNSRGRSAADSTMTFHRVSMGPGGLAAAYYQFAASDVRLLRDGLPAITGRKNVVRQMRMYTSIEFPTRVAQMESADMAYSWNPCSFSDSAEGVEKGNCMHVWKLHGKKWEIVLGVFARVVDATPPVLKSADPRNRKNRPLSGKLP